MRDTVQFKALLPPDVKEFLASEASRYGSTQSSEITRAVRERMERVQAAGNGNLSPATSGPAATGAGFADTTPAAAHSHFDALQGVGQFHP